MDDEDFEDEFDEEEVSGQRGRWQPITMDAHSQTSLQDDDEDDDEDGVARPTNMAVSAGSQAENQECKQQ